MRRKLAAHSQFNRKPKPIGSYSCPDDMTDLAAKIADRIRNNRHDARCGSYLLASEAGQVYVLREQGVSVTRMVQERAGWLVGFYAGDTVERRVRCPSPDEIAEDLAQHFDDLAGARG